MSRKIHTFDNGVRVYDDQLLPFQRERYKKNNVHEPEEEPIFCDLIKKIPENGCYLDIGSAIGYYPILAKKLESKLRIFVSEPLSKHRKYFIENLEINNLSLEDFAIFEEAVSSVSGTAKLVDENFSSHLQGQDDLLKNMKSSIGMFFNTIKSGKRTRRTLIPVNTIKFDDLIPRIGERVDLIQIDVQGHELSVLKGGVQTLNQNIVRTFLIGTHSKSLHFDCIHLLKDYGYSIEYENLETRFQPDGIVVATK